MKPNYKDMEIAVVLDSNKNAFMVDSEHLGNIYFLKLDRKGFPNSEGKWKEVSCPKWNLHSAALIEFGYAILFRTKSNGLFELDVIFYESSMQKEKLVRFTKMPGNKFNELTRL